MAREWFDYDPLTGVTEYFEQTTDGKIHITYEQDVEPLLAFNSSMRNEQIGDKNFKGEGWLYAAIPHVVVQALMKKGIDISKDEDAPRLLAEINTNYPYLKTTHRHHALTNGGIVIR